MARYRLTFEGSAPLRFSDFPGSAWRGALGHALRQMACTTHLAACPACPKYRNCAYTEVFETPPPADTEKMRKYPNVPHPFVLVHRNLPPGKNGETRRCELQLTLIGRGNRHFLLVAEAVRQAACGSRGISGNRLKLIDIRREEALGANTWPQLPNPLDGTSNEIGAVEMPPCPPEASLALLSPLRVKRDGRRVQPAEFRFSDLFVTLMRRISMLTYFHTDHPLQVDFKELAETSRTVEIKSELAWKELERYSFRQETKMQMGGLVGRFSVTDERLPLFWPFLWLGQWTHAGTGATMGLGQYTLSTSGECQFPHPVKADLGAPA